VSWPGADGLSLEIGDGGTVLLALPSRRVVTFHAVQEVLTTARVSHMFRADANLLLFNAVAHWLSDDDAQRTVCYVKDATCSAVVVLVRHTSVDGSIGFDVDDVPNLVDLQERCDGGHSILAEWAPEHVTSAAAVSLGIRHLSIPVIILQYMKLEKNVFIFLIF